MHAQEETRRIVEMEHAIAMLRAVFPANTPHVNGFTKYLEQQQQYKTMNKDQWQSFLRFVQEVWVCGRGDFCAGNTCTIYTRRSSQTVATLMRILPGPSSLMTM